MSHLFALVISVIGKNAFRFLNLCMNNKIKLRKVTKAENGYLVTVDARQLQQMKPLARKSNVKLRILKKKGIYFQVLRKTYFKKTVFALVSMLLLLYCSGFFVWRVEIIGNGQISQEQVRNWLKEKGIYEGCLISRVNQSDIEDLLRIELPQVAWDSLYIKNQTIFLYMKEVAEPTLPEEEAVCMDYVASEDAVISEIVIRSGKKVVQKGQEVKKGDLLVSGKVEVCNDAGEVISYLYEGANADVYGFVTCNKELWISSNQQECYETEQEQTYFFQNKRESVCYQNVIRSEKEMQVYASLKLEEFLSEMEENGMQITDKNVIIDKIGDLYYIGLELKGMKSIIDKVPTEYIEMEREGTVVDEFE